MSRISGLARVAGVLGRPIGHSLSPLIHNAWIEAAGLDAVYVPLSPAPGGLKNLFEACRGGLVAGFNVTVPFKEEALAAADTLSERAQRAGAANLVLFAADGSIAADSTDGAGLMAALADGGGAGRRGRSAERGRGPARGGRVRGAARQSHEQARERRRPRPRGTGQRVGVGCNGGRP
jgi:shikimate 5-dehydrogenase